MAIGRHIARIVKIEHSGATGRYVDEVRVQIQSVDLAARPNAIGDALKHHSRAAANFERNRAGIQVGVIEERIA